MTTDLEAMTHILATLEDQDANGIVNNGMVVQFMRHLMWHLEYQQNLIKLLLKDEPQIKAL